MKKTIKWMLLVLITLVVVTGCGKSKNTQEQPNIDNNNTNNTNNEGNQQEEIKVNTNEDVIGDKQIDVFKFEKTSLIYDDGTSILESKVTNTSNEVAYLSQFEIRVMNGEEELVTMIGYIGSELQPGQSKILTSSYGGDLTMATSIEYEIMR